MVMLSPRRRFRPAIPVDEGQHDDERKQLVAAVATVAALAATGTASAAASTPPPSPTESGAPASTHACR